MEFAIAADGLPGRMAAHEPKPPAAWAQSCRRGRALAGPAAAAQVWPFPRRVHVISLAAVSYQEMIYGQSQTLSGDRVSAGGVLDKQEICIGRASSQTPEQPRTGQGRGIASRPNRDHWSAAETSVPEDRRAGPRLVVADCLGRPGVPDHGGQPLESWKPKKGRIPRRRVDPPRSRKNAGGLPRPGPVRRVLGKIGPPGARPQTRPLVTSPRKSLVHRRRRVACTSNRVCTPSIWREAQCGPSI